MSNNNGRNSTDIAWEDRSILSWNLQKQIYLLLLYWVTSIFPWTHRNVNLIIFDIFIVNITLNAFNNKVYDKKNHTHRRKGIHVVLISKWHQPVILNKNTVDNWGCTLSHDVDILKGYYNERDNNPSCKYKRVIQRKTIFYMFTVTFSCGEITIT